MIFTNDTWQNLVVYFRQGKWFIVVFLFRLLKLLRKHTLAIAMHHRTIAVHALGLAYVGLIDFEPYQYARFYSNLE